MVICFSTQRQRSAAINTSPLLFPCRRFGVLLRTLRAPSGARTQPSWKRSVQLRGNFQLYLNTKRLKEQGKRLAEGWLKGKGSSRIFHLRPSDLGPELPFQTKRKPAQLARLELERGKANCPMLWLFLCPTDGWCAPRLAAVNAHVGCPSSKTNNTLSGCFWLRNPGSFPDVLKKKPAPSRIL